VRDGDFIELDCRNGRLHLDVADEEIASRLAERAENQTPLPKTGYAGLYIDHVLQADEGCDFDFLVGCRGSAVPKHSH
jgi:dihydroxyacid dehydratase/phosphogluconate dehydratase